MTISPVAPVQGDTIRFHRDLYAVLRKLGFSHPEVKAMSVRAALRIYFGSAHAVDAHLGAGTYRGVQQRYGGRGSWRKQWRRAIAEHEGEYQAQCAAIEHLGEATRCCRQLGVSIQDIKVAFHTALTPPTRVVPFEPPQQISKAQ